MKADPAENTKNAIKALQVNGKLEDRLKFFTSNYAPKFKNTNYYFRLYTPKNIKENAIDSYAKAFSVDISNILILYDSTGSLMFGLGKKGFIITSDCKIITSSNVCASLYKIDELQYSSDNKLIALPSNQILLEPKKVEIEDRQFINLLNKEVLAEKSSDDNELIECPNCGNLIEEGSAFCSNCGVRLGRCSCCKAIIEIDNAFCPECGNRLK